MIKNHWKDLFKKKKDQFILEGNFYLWKLNLYDLNHTAQCA